MEVQRKYGTGTTIYFPLITKDASDFDATPLTFEAGDIQLSKDGGAFANASNSLAHEGNGIYSLALTATEMEAGLVSVTVIDQTATKTWEDQAILLQTYGHASANLKIDLSKTVAEQVWDENLSSHTTNNTTGKVLKGINDGWVSAEGSVSDIAATTTSFVTDLTNAVNDFYIGGILIFISGSLKGLGRIVHDYDGTTKTIVFDEALPSAPADTDQFLILAGHQHTATEIGDAVRSSPVPSNVKYVNDIAVGGTGTLGDEWGPV